jgi:hypothetical protein
VAGVGALVTAAVSMARIRSIERAQRCACKPVAGG